MVAFIRISTSRIQIWRHVSQWTFALLLNLRVPLARLFPNVDFTRICLPVFECHTCPWALFACPVGVLAYGSAMHVWPLYVIAAVLLAAAVSGRLICGWACPFGLIQDLLFRIPVPGKFLLPRWVWGGPWIALVGLVVVGPFFLGAGVKNLAYFCNLCPGGALEASLPLQILAERTMRTGKWVVLFVSLAMMIWTHRPFCRIMCPLGAILSVGNRLSLFRIRLRTESCMMCKQCKGACAADHMVIEDPNTGNCIRCLDCGKACPEKRIQFR